MNQATAQRVVNALANLARANWYDFVRSPALCVSFRVHLEENRFIYTADRITCGRADCWSTYRELLARYPDPAPILADCEDLACAYAAWWASQCLSGVYVGLVVGKKVSHCIAGFEDETGKIQVADPSIWYGMGPTHYNDPLWVKIQ